MSRLYDDHAVVLRTYRLGEADRIVVLLTRGHGKVRAVAKGVRKTKSRFGGRLEPTSHIAVLMHEGRDLDIVSQAETVDQFREVRTDLDRFARASAMLEVVDQVAQEGKPDAGLYTMLVGALRTLDARDAPLVVPGFFLKLLAADGVRPNVDACVACGATDDLVAFDPSEGGVLCAAHRRGIPVSGAAIALLRLVLGGQLSAALDEPASPATREVSVIATHAMEHHLERRVRSITMIE
jgi:DNA repair protein RecO (recombination protein O)